MNLELVRTAYLPDAVLGVLHVSGHRFATLEDPWRPNPAGPGGQRKTDVWPESCIPDGVYTLRPHTGPKYQDVWSLSNPALGVYVSPGEIPAGQAWGRSAILIHWGNTVRDTLGCILVGQKYGRLNGQLAVLSSMLAIRDLRALLGNRDHHTLAIRPSRGVNDAEGVLP